MTPQLQQAIRLLQLSTLDLQQEIHQTLESNPMLDLMEPADEADDETEDESTLTSQPIEPVASPLAGQTVDYGFDNADFESRNAAVDTLQDYLLWQLNLTPMSEQDRGVAMTIIEGIDVNGMLTVDIESLHADLNPALEIELDEVLTVLHRIQHFDPVGVGYRNVAECLLIQLGQFEAQENSPAVQHAKLIISEHLPLLGNHDYAQLMRLTRLKEDDLRGAITIIESLDPRPGAGISPTSTTYVVPDVFVSKDSSSGQWKVELNPDTTPKLRINSDYAALVKKTDSSAENSYLRNNLQEARWFLSSLQSRNETLMKVATRIVEHQSAFLEHGEEAMKPLVLHEIAEAVGLHESTVSRVTTQKYMHTPRGIFDMKYFFSSHVSTTAGGECSSMAIRAIIKRLIAAESASKPLSDSKITTLLEEQGISVARRTIAKYREALAIPPSNERKRLV